MHYDLEWKRGECTTAHALVEVLGVSYRFDLMGLGTALTDRLPRSSYFVPLLFSQRQSGRLRPYQQPLAWSDQNADSHVFDPNADIGEIVINSNSMMHPETNERAFEFGGDPSADGSWTIAFHYRQRTNDKPGHV